MPDEKNQEKPKNLFFFTGEEARLIRQEVAKRQSSFAEKYGADSIVTFSPEGFDLARVSYTLWGSGLFDTKKLIILTGIPSDTLNPLRAADLEPLLDKITKSRQTIPQDHIVVFVSYKPDKRKKDYKFFSETFTLKEFKPLTDKSAANRIAQYLGDIPLAEGVADTIVSKVGSDLYRLSSELDKLKIRQQIHPGTITAQTVEEVTRGQTDGDSFALLEVLLTDPKASIALIDEAQDQGTDRNMYLGMLYRGVRIMVQIADALVHGQTEGKDIASEIGAHPFAVAKNLSTLKKM